MPADRAVLIRNVHRGLVGVAQDDGVSVAGQRAQSILQRLALLHRRVRRRDGNGASAQPLHGGVKRGRRASRRLVEERAEDAAAEHVQDALALNAQAHLLSNGEEQVQVGSGVLLDGQHVRVLERVGLRQQLLQRGAGRRLGQQGQTQLIHGATEPGRGGQAIDVAEPGRNFGALERRRLSGLGALRHLRDESHAGLQSRRDGHLAGDAVRRHVLALGRHRQELAIQADGGVLEGDPADGSAHDAALKRRPHAARLHLVGAVNLNLDAGADLVVELKDLHGLLVQLLLEVIHRQLALANRSEQERKGVRNAAGRVRLVSQGLGELVGQASDREDVNVGHVLPQSGLVLGRGQQSVQLGVVLGRQVQRVDGDVARHTQALGLAQRNQPDVVLVSDRCDVDAAVVQRGQQQDRGQVSQLGVGDNDLVRRPGIKVGGDGSHLANVPRQVVEGDEERAHLAGKRADLAVVVRGGRHGQVVVAKVAALAVLLGGPERDAVGDGALESEGHHADHAEAGRERGLGDRLHVVALGRDQAGNKGRDVDQAGQDNRLVAGLVIALGNAEVEAPRDGLDENLGVLDVGHQGDLVVNGHTTSQVTLAHVVGGAAVLVVRGQVDVQVNRVLGQVLRKRELRVLVLFLAENLEVLDRNAVLLQEVGGTGRSKQLVANLLQLLHRGQHLLLVLVRTNGQQNVLLGDLEPGGQQSLEVGLVLVDTKASDFTSRSHLNTENRIGARQARETELGHLDTNAIGRNIRRRVLLEGLAHDGLGSHLNQVHAHGLGHKGERAGSAHVALNDLDVVVLGNELDVKGASHVQGGTNLASGLLNALNGGALEILRGQDERSITRVHTGVLDVLGNEVADDNTILGDCVHLNLLGVLNVLGNDNGVLARHLRSLGQVALQILLRVHSVHGSAREHVRRADQHRVRHVLAERPGLLKAGKLLPGRLVNANPVQHARELVSVLGGVNHLRRSTQDLDTGAVQGKGNVVGRLASHGTQNTARAFQLVDIQHRLQRNVLKVQFVGLVVIGRNRLRIVIHHDGLVAGGSEGADGPDGAPVELDGRTDTVHTRAEDHDAVVAKVHVVLGGVVGEVQVVGKGRELGSDRIDLLDKGLDASIESEAADGDFVGAPELGQLAVAEAETLGLEEQVGLLGNVGGGELGHLLGEVAEPLELAEEPLVDPGHFPDLVDRVALGHGVGNGKETLVRGRLQLVVDAHERLGLAEAEVVEVNGADGLLDGFLERATNAHDLANTLH
ncbi:hypothetical protein MKX07_008575 [Trichoderma sp. CBMAI-0711]|nr:hypothetical protein MKX07_008575 [Trichoderma sp. CBMAI-0711]